MPAPAKTPLNYDTIDDRVADNLRMLRLKAGLSQESLGELSSLKQQRINRYEDKLNRISAGNLFRLSKALKVPVSAFFKGVKLEKVK